MTNHCDNEAVVAFVNFGHHRTSCTYYGAYVYEAHGQFRLKANHLPGVCNGKEDDLSRGNWLVFLSKTPEANRYPSLIPPALPSLLLIQDQDWISPGWTEMFKYTLNKA